MSISRTTQSKIHIARQQLGLDDDVYRSILESETGLSSTKFMTEGQAQRVLKAMSRLGWKPKRSKDKGKGKPHNFDKLPELITKIEAQLADMELPWSYADSIANRMWKRQRIAWTSEPEKLKAIISALHYEQEKRSLLATIEQRMAKLGPSAPIVHAPRRGWTRHIPTLRRLAEELGHAVDALEDN